MDIENEEIILTEREKKIAENLGMTEEEYKEEIRIKRRMELENKKIQDKK